MKARLFLPLVMALLACAGGATAETVKLQSNPSVLLVDCKINGSEAGRFLLNPAQCATTMVSPELVTRLGLQDRDGRVTVTLDVAGMELKDQSLVVGRNDNYSHSALKPFAGMLGYDVASKLRITLDYRRGTATLARSRAGERPKEGGQRAVLKIDTSGNLPIVTLKADGQELKALVDICTTQSALSPDAAQRFEGTGSRRAIKLTAGNHDLGKANFVTGISPRLQLIRAERGVNIDAVLGVDFLSNYTVTLDLSNGILVLDAGGVRPTENREDDNLGKGQHKSNSLGVIYEFDEGTKTAGIVEVLPGGPARAQKLQVGDIIVKVNGVRPESAEHLGRLLKPGSAVELSMKRGEWVKTIRLKLAATGDGEEIPAPDAQGETPEEIKKLLRDSGFSEEQIETLLRLFELRIRASAPGADKKGAVAQMEKAGFSQSQAEALAKLFKMKKGYEKGPEPEPEATPLQAAIQNALERGVTQEQIDKVVRTGKLLKWPEEKIIELINGLKPKEAPGEKG